MNSAHIYTLLAAVFVAAVVAVLFSLAVFWNKEKRFTHGHFHDLPRLRK